MSSKLTLTQALCITHAGWITEAEHTLYLEAQSLVYKEARRHKIDREIEALTSNNQEKLEALRKERADLGEAS